MYLSQAQGLFVPCCSFPAFLLDVVTVVRRLTPCPCPVIGPYINLINQCDYDVVVSVGAVNGTSYPNQYAFVSDSQTIGNKSQTLTLQGTWPGGLAYATRANGTVVSCRGTALLESWKKCIGSLPFECLMHGHYNY